MATFRVAHLTDLHFGRKLNWFNPIDSAEDPFVAAKEAIRHIVAQNGRAGAIFYPSTFNPDAALQLLKWLADELPDLHAVLVTGDLSTTGGAADLALAHQFFSDQGPPLWSPVPMPLVLAEEEVFLMTLPGNHDRYGLLAQPSSPLFETFFGKYWDFDRELAFPVVNPITECGRVRLATLQDNDDGSYLGIVCADLSLETTSSGVGLFGWIGQGQAAQQIVKELVSGTTAARRELLEEKKPFGIVWAIHFPPAFPDVQENAALLQFERLLEAAADCDVTHILCGHTHKTLMYDASSTKGPVTVICSGPSSGISRHGTYWFSVLEIEVSAEGRTFVTPTAFSWKNFRFQKEDTFPVP